MFLNTKINKTKIKTWFVTGASKGIGYRLCCELLTRGYNVVAIARTLPNIKHDNVLCLKADITNIEDVRNAIAASIKRFKTIDVLVNNAGVSASISVEEESEQHMKNVMDINFFGAFNVIHELLPHFRENKNGTIINNTSQSGISFRAYGGAYVSSKHALEGLTSVLWQETKSFCRVMAVELGWFPGTNITQSGDMVDIESKYEEYKDLDLFYRPFKRNYINNVGIAVDYIIKQAEQKKMPRRLILGKDAIYQISQEILDLKSDLNKSLKKAKSVSEKHLHNNLFNTTYKDPDIKNVGLLNFHWENVNFGAVLTSYALNAYLNNNGYYARNIDYVPSFPWIAEEKPNKFFDDFRRTHMPMTRRFLAGSDMSELNDEFAYFVVGSDQVWRHDFIKKDQDAYFFTFAKPNKNLVSYAASFGIDTLNADEYEKDNYKHMLSLFDWVSVREDSGVAICKDLGINATKVMDPVFLLDKSQWDNLAAEFDKDTESGSEAVFYTIDEEIEDKIKNFINDNKNKLSTNGVKNITYDTSVQEWLWRIKNCKFFVTDSYHGSCFAIIFNKPFVCVNPNKGTTTRMQSLFDLLKISGRLYSDFNDVDIEKLPPIDYKKVNKIIADTRKSSVEFLEHALSSVTQREHEKQNMIDEHNTLLLTQAKQQFPRLRYKYYLYKTLAKITIGGLHKKFKKKRKSYREKYYRAKHIIKKLEKTK